MAVTPAISPTRTATSGRSCSTRRICRPTIDGRARPSIAARRLESLRLAAPRRLDRRDVDLLHVHHRLEGSLPLSSTSLEGLGQNAWRYLPGEPPFILAPAARAL